MFDNLEGKEVPQVVFHTRKDGAWLDVTTDELFAGKTVIVFSLPGAFTPTCSASHLPGFNSLSSKFKQLGIDDILCISVNDAFVMNAWAKDEQADEVRLIPDGNGEFTDKMGLLVGKEDLGFGKRSWRYSMLVRDKVIEKMFIEPSAPGDPFEVSDAHTMLDYLSPQKRSNAVVSLFSKAGCPYCVRAKQLLTKKGYEYEEILIEGQVSMSSVIAITGRRTVPQIFIEGQHIGGSDDLTAYLERR